MRRSGLCLATLGGVGFRGRPVATGWAGIKTGMNTRMCFTKSLGIVSIDNYQNGNPMLEPSTFIHRDKDILGGQPVFVGTRVPVRILFEYLEAGDSLNLFLDDFPSVSREQAVAALSGSTVGIRTCACCLMNRFLDDLVFCRVRLESNFGLKTIPTNHSTRAGTWEQLQQVLLFTFNNRLPLLSAIIIRFF